MPSPVMSLSAIVLAPSPRTRTGTPVDQKFPQFSIAGD
jgi:hypothetical protein